VRLDAAYYFDADTRTCVIDSGSEVGRDVCRIFGGLAIREFGETAFTVSRAHRTPAAVPETTPSAAQQELRA
jgi:hypothetical protein